MFSIGILRPRKTSIPWSIFCNRWLTRKLDSDCVLRSNSLFFTKRDIMGIAIMLHLKSLAILGYFVNIHWCLQVNLHHIVFFQHLILHHVAALYGLFGRIY